MHCVWSSLKEGCVWHWQLLPHDSNLPLIAKNFEVNEVLPNWNALYHFSLPTASSSSSLKVRTIPYCKIESYGHREATDRNRNHMHTTYEDGRTALWLGDNVFFCVEEADPIWVHPPTNTKELPPWVLQLLTRLLCHGQATDPVDETDPYVQPARVEENVNAYLRIFSRPSTLRGLDVLRRINWGILPLYWKPIFFKDVDRRVSVRTAYEAQAQLISSLGLGQTETEETLQLLNQLTLVHQ